MEMKMAYLEAYRESVDIIECGGKTFLFPKALPFDEKYYNAFFAAAEDPSFENPIYVDIIDGDLCLD